MAQLAKSNVFSSLNFGSVDDMNFALVELGDHIKQNGEEPGDELVNPDKYEEIDSTLVKLLRDKMQQALDRPALTEQKPEAALTEQSPQVLATNEEYNRDRLSGLTNVLTQLGFEIGMMVGTALSEEKWDAIEEAYEQNDQRRLTEFVKSHQTEFESVEVMLASLDSKRASRRAGTLGKLNELGDLGNLRDRRTKVLTR
ncbi:hypothetical protein [Allocoleopsis sp.]|uniref:hypothetical protein n=1 Tax=Allocoleopsis sp. TaxID=3088169 RepID=UPI002FD1B471